MYLGIIGTTIDDKFETISKDIKALKKKNKDPDMTFPPEDRNEV